MTELAHYGVKGMRWGVSKAGNDSPNANYSPGHKSYDRQKHGNRSVKRINRRMNEGKTLKEARRAEIRRNRRQRTAVAVGYTTVRALQVFGPIAVQSIASRAETKRGEAFVAANLGLPRTATSSPNYAKKKRGTYNISSL